MELVVVRHAKAEERSSYKNFSDDRKRALTPEGIEKMKKIASALHERIPKLDSLVTSPLVRAMQTAEILREEYEVKAVQTTELLSPGFDKAELLLYLKKKSSEEFVCLVGHEPDLGELCSWLLTGNSTSFIPFRKSGVCVLRFTGAILPKNAELVFKMDPRHF